MSRATTIIRPDGPPIINWQSPQAQGLNAFWPLNVQPIRDVIQKIPATYYNSQYALPLQATSQGRMVQLNWNTYVDTNSTLYGSVPSGLTLGMWCQVLNDQTTGAIASNYQGGGYGFILYVHSSYTLNVAFYGYSNNVLYASTDAYAFAPGVPFHAELQFDPAAKKARVGVNGKFGNWSDAGSGSGPVFPWSSTLRFGKRGYLDDYWVGAGISHVTMHARSDAALVLQQIDPRTRWDLYWRRKRAYLFIGQAGGGATYIGSGSLAVSKVTLAGAGTFTPPTFSGAGTLLIRKPTVSGAGTFTPPTFTGSGTLTITKPTISASAIFIPPTFTALGSLSIQKPTLVGTGTFTPPTFTGSGTLTITKPVLTGSGVFTSPTFTGSGTLTVTKPILTGVGNFTPAGVTIFHGGGSLLVPKMTLTAVGSFTVPTFAGSGTLITRKMAVHATGSFLPPGGLADPAIYFALKTAIEGD